MKKEEMIYALGIVAASNGYFEDNSQDEAIFYPDCSTEIEEYFLEPEESEKYIAEQVDQRGSEGDGAEMYRTFKIKTGQEECYVEFSGRYSSWDSSNYDDFYFVQPEEVMIIQYKRIKG